MIRFLSYFALAGAALAPTVQADTPQRLNLQWNLLPGSRDYVTTGGFQRGMAVDPAAGENGHIYIVSRAGGTLQVPILDAADGAEIGFLDTTGIDGGTFDLSTIGVADDGVIFAANLTTNAGGADGPFRLYRWADHTASPQQVYTGDPGFTPSRRWGDAMAVRGSGDDTRILITSHSGNNDSLISLLSPGWPGATDFFTEQWLSEDPDLALGIGLAFASGNSFYGTSVSGTLPRGLLHRIDFDPSNASTTTTTFTDEQFDRRHSILGHDAGRDYLIAAAPAGGDLPTRLSVYDASQLAAGEPPLQTLPFAVSNTTAGGTGAIEVHGDRVFVLLSNNGLHVYEFTDLTALEIWREENFGTLENTGVAANTADPDGDGIPNLLEFALGLNPNEPDRGDLPVLENATFRMPLWYLAPGERDYLSASGNTERGMAYNPVTGNAYVVSRALDTLRVAILDGATGAHEGFLNVSGIIGAGGTFDLSLIGVAADGAIYGANLTTNAASIPFRVYRWADETAAPVEVYAGSPGETEGGRWGDNLAVRGEGLSTRLLVLTHSTNASVFSQMSVLRPTDASMGAFVSEPLSPPLASVGIGTAFGDGDEFWATRANIDLHRIGFDPQTGAAGPVDVFDAAALNGIGPIGVHVGNGLLGGINAGDDGVYLFDLAGFQEGTENPPLFVHTLPTSTASPGGGTGAVAFGEDRFFAMHTNNGLVAFEVETASGEPVNIRGEEFATLTYSRPAPAPDGVDYIVEVSSDLVSWDAEAAVRVSSATDTEIGRETVVYRDTESSDGHTRRFMRLRVAVAGL